MCARVRPCDLRTSPPRACVCICGEKKGPWWLLNNAIRPVILASHFYTGILDGGINTFPWREMRGIEGRGCVEVDSRKVGSGESNYPRAD